MQVLAVDRHSHSFVHLGEVLKNHVTFLRAVVDREQVIHWCEVAVHALTELSDPPRQLHLSIRLLLLHLLGTSDDSVFKSLVRDDMLLAFIP